MPFCSTFALEVVLFGSHFVAQLLCMKSMTFTLSIVLSNLHSRSHKYRITIYTISFEKLTKILKYLCSLTLVSNIRPFWCHLCFKAVFTGFRKYYNKLDDVNEMRVCFLLVFTTINKGVWCLRFVWRFFEIQNNLEPVWKD